MGTLKPIIANNLLENKYIKHGFFTRIGGVSQGDFASLNTSFFTNDNVNNIIKNREIVKYYFGSSDAKLITLKQIHSNNTIVVQKNYLPDYLVEGDALITNQPNIILGVHTADCIPILVSDHKNKAIAAIHCGYLGAFSGIIENTINKMLDFNIDIKNLIVAIGPSIQQKSYEVSEDFYNEYAKYQNNEMFFIRNKKHNKYYLSLSSYVKSRFTNLQINNIININLDTFTNNKLFFSHRYSIKNNIKRGLQISSIMLKEKK